MFREYDFYTKKEKEVDDMNTSTLPYRRLDFSKISNRIVGNISSEEALKDITPVNWSDEVISGKKKVVITKDKNME